jgi:hypothetical protein
MPYTKSKYTMYFSLVESVIFVGRLFCKAFLALWIVMYNHSFSLCHLISLCKIGCNICNFTFEFPFTFRGANFFPALKDKSCDSLIIDAEIALFHFFLLLRSVRLEKYSAELHRLISYLLDFYYPRALSTRRESQVCLERAFVFNDWDHLFLSSYLHLFD